MQLQTKDSTITLFNTFFNESYHSANDGALRETLHKHIFPVLSFLDSKDKKDSIIVLDICFGLGFNTLSFMEHYKGAFILHTPEMDGELLKKLLNHPYPKELESKKEVLAHLVKNQVFVNKDSKLFLYLGDARILLQDFLRQNICFDIIFQDPFSPLKNPNLWTYEYFKMLYRISKKDVLITTYSQNSKMLYSAFLAGFYSFKVEQKEVRDSVIFTKYSKIPAINCANILNIKPINILHKIKTNKHLKGLYD